MTRFNQVKNYMESLTKWAEVSRDDSSLVVDTGDLELQLGQYQEHIDELLAISPVPENQKEIGRKIVDLWASVGWIKAVCDDLNGPLERLISAVSADEDDEDDDVDGEPDR